MRRISAVRSPRVSLPSVYWTVTFPPTTSTRTSCTPPRDRSALSTPSAQLLQSIPRTERVQDVAVVLSFDGVAAPESGATCEPLSWVFIASGFGLVCLESVRP